MITLELWINGIKMSTRTCKRADKARTAKSMKDEYWYKLSRSDWQLFQVGVQSKMNKEKPVVEYCELTSNPIQ